MFGSLARRLTAWYVVVAVMLVVLLAGSVAISGLLLFARDLNDQIGAVARQIPDVEARAIADRDNWKDAGDLLVRRVARPGIKVQLVQVPGQRALPRNAEFGVFRLPDRRAVPPWAGQRSTLSSADSYRPFYGDRIGRGVAAFLGIHPQNRPFLGGVAFVFADSDRIRDIVAIALGILVVTGLLAGVAAWGIGRYITSEALRPLYAVTASLVRFAGRDFTAQPIDVAGRSEFDALARAYNAAAAQVQAAFDERAAAEAQMRQFVADAGHELRTPLTIVLGYIDMLKRRAPDDERSRRIFHTIAIEGSRMRTLIDNLVLLARLEGVDVRPAEPFELTPLLEDDIVRTRRGIAPHREFRLAIDVDATIIGNRGEIYEALANVVDNALKYAPGSPIDIRVGAADGGVAVTISDRGPGIADAERDAIFDRFYRGGQRGEVEGSGLGLPIAKRAIERAGGSLRLAQSSPAGTTFAVVLRADRVVPRRRPPTPAEERERPLAAG